MDRQGGAQILCSRVECKINSDLFLKNKAHTNYSQSNTYISNYNIYIHTPMKHQLQGINMIHMLLYNDDLSHY